MQTGSIEARTMIRVRNVGKARPIQFATRSCRALTKAGCNAGACHGTPAGKNGFRLQPARLQSGTRLPDPARENGTRRTNAFEPEASLILLKGTGRFPHEGGRADGDRERRLPRASATGWPRGSGPTRRTRPDSSG